MFRNTKRRLLVVVVSLFSLIGMVSIVPSAGAASPAFPGASPNPLCKSDGYVQTCVTARPHSMTFVWTASSPLFVISVGFGGFTSTRQKVPEVNKIHNFNAKSYSYTFNLPVAALYQGNASLNNVSSLVFTEVVGPDTNYVVNKGLHAAHAGKSYTATLRAAGGAPYTWKMKHVPGLKLGIHTGLLSGTPKKGKFTVSVSVSNKYGLVATAKLPLTVN